MAIAQWNDELRTGVSKVDGQHLELINKINELHAALSQGKGKDKVEDAVQFLSGYVIEHFQTEEKMMVENGYPALAAHKKQHEQFIHDFTKLVQEYNTSANSSFFAITIQRSIVQWLVNHIMKTDKEMAKFVIAKTGGKVA
jgi:hemerythrin